MKSPNELSFLPEDYLQRKARRRANILCASLSVLVMGAIATGFVLTEKSMRALEKRHAEVDKTYADAARQIEMVSQMEGQHAKIVRRAELASSLVEKVPRSNLLAELTNALPPGVSLLDLSLESKLRAAPAPPPKSPFEQKKAKAEAARKAKNKKPGEADPAEEKPKDKPKVYDVSLKLTGVADTDVQVAQFMTKLGDSKLLKDVNLLVSDEFKQGDLTMRRFQIELMLDPRAEVRDEAPPLTKTAAVELDPAAGK